MAKALITGGSGFIGTHLADVLASRGDEVTALVRRTSRVAPLQALGVRLAYGDVTDPESLRQAVAGADVVYHLAGRTACTDWRDFYRTNTAGTVAVAAACAQRPSPPTLLIVSSLAAAGPASPGRPRRETDPPRPVSHYGRSKRLAEQAVQRLAHRMPITIVRPPIVFGPWDHLVYGVFNGVARTGIHLCPTLGRHYHSLIHGRDLANFLVLAAQRGKRLVPHHEDVLAPSQGIYFVACERDVCYAEFGRLISQALGRHRMATIFVASPLVWLTALAGEAAARLLHRPLIMNLDKYWEITAGSWTCSPRKAVAELGFAVETPLPQRICQTVAWYREMGMI